MTTLHHTSAPVHTAYLAVADLYVDDIPEGPSAADSAWWARESDRRAEDRHFDDMATLSAVLDRYETGLSDFDVLPAGIA